MKIYRSKKGETGTMEYWQNELKKFWSTIDINDTERHSIKQPPDALERMFRVLGVKEID